MAGIDFDICVPRNGDYFRTWQLVDDEGAPVDLTGHALVLAVRAAAGEEGEPIASATITIEALPHGNFDVLLHGAHFDDVPGPMEIVRLAYDLKRTDPTGIITVEVRGAVILKPGVS
jgi:hypothetical protein